MNCFKIFCSEVYKTESMNDWLFCEEGVCSIPVVFAFLPSMWPLLWTCTGLCQHLDGEEELSYAPEHTVPFAVRRKGAELSEECRNSSGTTWKLSVLIPLLWLVVNFGYYTTGRAFRGHAHLEKKKVHLVFAVTWKILPGKKPYEFGVIPAFHSISDMHAAATQLSFQI